MTVLRKAIKLQKLDKLTNNTIVLELSRNAPFCNWHPAWSGMPPSVVHKPCHLPCSVETFVLNYSIYSDSGLGTVKEIELNLSESSLKAGCRLKAQVSTNAVG